MTHRRHFYGWFAILAAIAGLHCAPADPTPRKAKAKGDPEVAVVVADPPQIPDLVKDRVEAALDHVRKRDLLTNHGFWTIFHGILGMGIDTTELVDPDTRKRVNAIKFICDGGELRGMRFNVTPHGLDVQSSAPGSDIPIFVGQGHQDQFVAEMVQWGLPLNKKFRIGGKDFEFRDFINHSKMRSSTTKNQELSWAVLIVGEHFGTDHAWVNSFDEKINMQDVLRYELAQNMDTSACGGTHRLFGLTWVLHRHRERGGKIDGAWKDVAAKLDFYKDHARKHRNADGSFSTDYFKGPGNKGETQDRINTSGHIFEWLALHMTDAELKEPWVQEAASALARMILISHLDPVPGGALYHAAHGLHIFHERVYGNPKAKKPYPTP